MIEFLDRYYLPLFSGIGALIYLKIGLKTSTDKPLRFIALYLISYFAINFLSSFYADNGWNNHFLSHFYFIPQFILLSLFYRSLFNKFQKQIVNFILIVVLSFLTIQYSLNHRLFLEINPLEVLITCSPLVVYAIIHLYNSLTQKGRYLYINAGVLFYISISTLIFILFRLLSIEDFEFNRDPIFLTNKVLAVCYVILFIVEYRQTIWKHKKKL